MNESVLMISKNSLKKMNNKLEKWEILALKNLLCLADFIFKKRFVSSRYPWQLYLQNITKYVLAQFTSNKYTSLNWKVVINTEVGKIIYMMKNNR